MKRLFGIKKHGFVNFGYFLILFLLLLSIFIFKFINFKPFIFESNENKELAQLIYSGYIDFNDDGTNEYFTSMIIGNCFSYDISQINGNVINMYHFEKQLSFQLRHQNHISIVKSNNKYFIIENDFSYGMAGGDYISNTLIKTIVDGEFITVHNLIEKTKESNIVDVDVNEDYSSIISIEYYENSKKIDEKEYRIILNAYTQSIFKEILLEN